MYNKYGGKYFITNMPEKTTNIKQVLKQIQLKLKIKEKQRNIYSIISLCKL